MISNLPDDILSVILSKLPTKNAVATSVLSKRWEFMWTTIHNLDFWYNGDHILDFYSCYGRDNDDENDKFVRFVNHVLLHLDGGSRLDKFRLVWRSRCIPAQVSSWIDTAFTRNIHELVLCVGSTSDPCDLPLNLLCCKTLHCLELNGIITVPAAVVVSLPRLESLTLVSVFFKSEETFQKLVCGGGGCPKLNYLHVVDSEIATTRTLELEASSSLEYLKLDGPIHQVFVHQGSLSSIVEAEFNVYLTEYNQDIYNSVAKGVRCFECAKALTLSHDVMWALSNATISLSTKFTRLTKLDARVVCCYCNALQDFIQSSDNLQVLKISKQTYELEIFNHDHLYWSVHVDVPKCLSNNLKEVSFEGYSGCEDEREIISYLLKHGSALEVMQITCDEDNLISTKIEMVKEIRGFPRKSPACKVEFIR